MEFIAVLTKYTGSYESLEVSGKIVAENVEDAATKMGGKIDITWEDREGEGVGVKAVRVKTDVKGVYCEIHPLKEIVNSEDLTGLAKSFDTKLFL